MCTPSSRAIWPSIARSCGSSTFFGEHAVVGRAEQFGGHQHDQFELHAAEDAIGVVLADGGVLPLLDADGRVVPVRAVTFGTRLSEQVEVEPWLLPTAIDWTRETELTRGLDLSELVVERAWRSMLPPGKPLLWCHDGEQRRPLAVLVDAGETASVHFAFRLHGNLPLLPAFPQLLLRALVR